MTSAVSICNQALDEIGKDNINALTEDSVQARKCLQHYDDVRRSLLSSYHWKFARKAIAMASMPVTSAYDQRWVYAFLLPKDCLKVIRIIRQTYIPADYRGPKYDVVGTQIMTNDYSGFLEYTADIVSENYLPPLFVDAFAFALAARLCMPLTNNMQGKVGIVQMARSTYTAATVWDSNQVHENSDHQSEMLQARL